MARNHVFRSILLAAGLFVSAACASQPAAAAAPAAATVTAPARTPLLEKKFQIAAKYYQKYQHEGQVVYCRKDNPPPLRCLTEAQLRRQVENFEKRRNPVEYNHSG